MDKDAGRKKPVDRGNEADVSDLPAPTPQYRRRAWQEFQRALDPLAPPRPLPKASRQPR